jgi:aspartyl-tRNA(Asn)/glutamyl-tRNA(Gln) amidotransferase subunit A
VLEGAGATVAEVDLSCLSDLDAGATVLTQAESASLHRAAVRDRPEDYAPAVRSRIHAGLICQGSDHVDALRYQGRALRDMLDGPLAQTDVLFCPVTRTGAPLASGQADDEATTIRLSVEMLRLNRPFSFIGLPAVSLPVGFSPEGLPAGVQLVGRPWAEPRLLGCAAAYQARTDWHRQIPDIPAQTTTR